MKMVFEMTQSDVGQACIRSVEKNLPKPEHLMYWDLRWQVAADGGMKVIAEQKQKAPEL